MNQKIHKGAEAPYAMVYRVPAWADRQHHSGHVPGVRSERRREVQRLLVSRLDTHGARAGHRNVFEPDFAGHVLELYATFVGSAVDHAALDGFAHESVQFAAQVG